MKQSEYFPQTWDAYAYVANQPLTLVDPLGLVCQEDQVNQDCEPGFSQGTGGYGDGGFGGGDSGGGWSEFGLMQVPVVQQYGYSLAYFGGTQQPLALATCLPGLGLGGAVVASGAGDLWLSYHFFTQQTLPAFGSWG